MHDGFKSSDKAYKSYKSFTKKAKAVGEKIAYHLRGGEYGANQNERAKRYRERGEKLNEQWTK